MAKFAFNRSKIFPCVLTLATLILLGHLMADTIGVSPEVTSAFPCNANCADHSTTGAQLTAADVHLGSPALKTIAPSPTVTFQFGLICSMACCSALRLTLAVHTRIQLPLLS